MPSEVDETMARLAAAARRFREDDREAVAELSALLRAFWAYYRAGEPDLAARLLDWAADAEYEWTGDCNIAGELSERLGFDDYLEDDERACTSSRAERAELLEALLRSVPLG